MSYYASAALPWTVSEEDEQRFRTILRRLLIFFVLLSVIMPFLPVPKFERQDAEVPPRLAKLLLERQTPPPPPPVAKAPEPETVKPDTAKPEPKVAKPEKIEKVEPKKDVEVARRKAARSGLLAFKDDLADLRENPVAEKLAKNVKPGPGVGAGKGPGVGNTSGPALGAGARSLITSNVTSGSGGVNTSRLSHGFGGGGLAGQSTTQVNSPVGGGGGGGGGSVQRGGGGSAARSLEEIKLVFDKNKSAIYAIYNRALREDPRLQGKVVLRLTISPAGAVTACDIVSSELRAPELERKLVARIKQFDFGAKDVNIMVVTYPIDFLPS